ncbi:LAME_0D00606g1_1 [Lachancea meyersii CBS 8951]|uniref:LAME_0D00606g1_1 n=1 Tax=Lachancea meyersii CBS 8951 TaxID=1266667 RepID=A0A1G4J6N1_9SACH|nr:LAME_0D00606g1_1 [Lachancea meyersii CBS 8951]
MLAERQSRSSNVKMNEEREGIGRFSPAPHELSSKTFKRTPTGLVFTEDLKRVFSILLICLDLKERPNVPHKNPLFPPFHKSYPFSFGLKEAISKMRDLMLQVDMTTTKVSVSYSIQPELARRMLKTFMDAKLLHVPADRTRAALKDGVAIQPTPKGVAVLQRYVRHTGLKDIPSILKSDLNTMELFTFERSSMTDAIIHSDYFVSLLFAKVMGLTKNVWSPDNSPDQVPTLANLLKCADDTFNFENVDFAWGAWDGSGNGPTPTLSHPDAYSIPKSQDQNRISPLTHRFFTNPDSTSHAQYYTSSSGLRLFKANNFADSRVSYDCVFSTKAVWQWLMDCTDIMYPKEAVTISSLFLRNGLMKPITLSPSGSYQHKFSIGTNCFFTLTQLGWESVQWSSGGIIKNEVVGADIRNVNSPRRLQDEETKQNLTDSGSDSGSDHKPGYFTDLTHVLRDPGMRYLFRRHLEKEFCAENLDVYIEIKKFLKRMTVLKNLLDTKTSKEPDNIEVMTAKHFSDLVVNTINHALFRQANECLETAYQIYSSFITPGAPYQLNIDHSLRESITEVILHPQPCMFISCPDENTITADCLNCVDPGADMVISNEQNSPAVRQSADQTNQLKHNNSEMVRRSLISTVNSDEIEGESFSSILKTLRLIYPLFERVASSMFQLMKIDSLPKFINSELYQEAAVMLNFEAKNE